MKISFPNKIQEGSTIGFFNPSSPLNERQVKHVKLGIKTLRDWGYSTEQLNDETFDEWKKLRPPNIRVNEFYNKIKDPRLNALIATWGGKNSSDLLPYLDFELIRKYEKSIIGTSDIAVLLNAITWRSGFVTFHGPNVLGKLNQTKEIGFPLLKRNEEHDSNLFTISPEIEFHILNQGYCTGRLVGGSLGTFTLGLSGTEYIPGFKEMVFFFESSSLDYIKVRQHLQNLRMTGFLENVVGVIIGAMTKFDNSNIDKFNTMILSTFSDSIPIIKSNLFGHGMYYNPTFPIGVNFRMDTERQFFGIHH